MSFDSGELHSLLEKHRGAQWFTGKNRRIERVTVYDAAKICKTADGAETFFSVLEIKYQDDGIDLFQLPIRFAPQHALSDALEDRDHVIALVRAIRDRARIATKRGTLLCEVTHGSDAYFPREVRAARVERLSGPQSNFSYKIDDALIFKAYAKPEPDVSIEREMAECLVDRGYAATPRLVGSLTLQTDRPYTVGLLFELAKNQGDGWRWVLDQIERGKGDDPELLDRLELLGRRVGELHHALGSPTDDPAFHPEPITKESLEAWAEILHRELEETLEQVRAKDPELGARLDAARRGLENRISAVRSAEPSGQYIRIHGDLHLGQVLVKDKDWVVIDFEGEPTRNKEHRRRKYSPLKDVAGVLRSFGYAEAQCTRAGMNCPKGWAHTASEKFLAGYRGAVSNSELLPKNEETFTLVLAAAEMEKALYEVRYELVSRPDWVEIPLSRVLEIGAEAQRST
jgi:maltokinase